MISLLMSCKTQQLSRQKTTVVATDTTTISRVVTMGSSSLNANIDSIIIEEYAVDQSELITDGQILHGNKKRNDTSQKGAGLIKKKTKIYGASISGTWFSKNDSLNKKMAHQEKTDTQIRQKTPMQNNAGGKIGYIIIAMVAIILVGYLIGKNAVQ